jgi:rhodanese-related sulfurtransferase
LQVTAWLRARGLENCYSIAGGIDRWSREIDSTVPTY